MCCHLRKGRVQELGCRDNVASDCRDENIRILEMKSWRLRPDIGDNNFKIKENFNSAAFKILSVYRSIDN